MRSLIATFPLLFSPIRKTLQGCNQLNRKASEFPYRHMLPYTYCLNLEWSCTYMHTCKCYEHKPLASICLQSGWGWRTEHAGSQGETLDLETNRGSSRDTARQGRLCNKDKILWQSAHYIKVERAKLIPGVRTQKPMELYSGQIWFQKPFFFFKLEHNIQWNLL